MWATEYFNALLIIDYKSEAKENRSQMFWGFLCMSDLSKQQINLSTSKSFYFWISCVWILSDACGLYSFVQFSMCVLMPVCLLHCQHVWHYENGLTCDAFSVSDAGAAKHLLVLSSFFFFFLVYLFAFVLLPLFFSPRHVSCDLIQMATAVLLSAKMHYKGTWYQPRCGVSVWRR